MSQDVTVKLELRKIIAKQFSVVTVQNEMKFQFIHPQRDLYSFKEADQVVDFALANGLKVHGHTFVYDTSLPAWITQQDQYDSQDLKNIIYDHIRTVIGYYKGKVHEWDLVNEAMAWDSNESADGLSRSIWKRIAKSPEESYDYIDQMFWVAH